MNGAEVFLKSLGVENYPADTPERMDRGYRQLLTVEDPCQHVKLFEHDGRGETITVGCTFSSMCEHHVMPFWGSFCFMYVPDKTILGLSKFPRIVRAISRGLWTQERLTQKVHEFMVDAIRPREFRTRSEANHSCAEFRGAESRVETIVEVRYVFG